MSIIVDTVKKALNTLSDDQKLKKDVVSATILKSLKSMKQFEDYDDRYLISVVKRVIDGLSKPQQANPLSVFDTIKKSIDEGWTLIITYKGEGGNRPRKRVVEPFTLGIDARSGKVVMAAWHRRGFSLSQNSPPWRLYRLDRFFKCELEKNRTKDRTGVRQQGYRQNRPGYKPPDQRMSTIYADMAQKFKTV